MPNIKIKKIIYTIIGTYIGYKIIMLLYVLSQSHSATFKNHKDYLWLFKKSEQLKLDTFYSSGDIRESDVLHVYNYDNLKYSIDILDLKEVTISNLYNIEFQTNKDLDNFKIDYGEQLSSNSKFPGSILFDIPFKEKIIVKLDVNSKIIREISGKNYKGIYGNVYEFILANEDRKELIKYHNERDVLPTYIIFYKLKGRIIMIRIKPNRIPIKDFDKNIINILNLE